MIKKEYRTAYTAEQRGSKILWARLRFEIYKKGDYIIF